MLLYALRLGAVLLAAGSYGVKELVSNNKIKGEIRCEKLLIFFMLNFIFIRSDVDLENISFM